MILFILRTRVIDQRPLLEISLGESVSSTLRKILETGIVKWSNVDKNFGFIMPEASGKDLFAHISDIQGDRPITLTGNQRVSYTTGAGAKGPQATKIRAL